MRILVYKQMNILACTECTRMSLEGNFLSTRDPGAPRVLTTKGKNTMHVSTHFIGVGVCRVCDPKYHTEHSDRIAKQYASFLRKYPTEMAENIQSGYLKTFLAFLYSEYWYFEVNTAAYRELLLFMERIPQPVIFDNQADINYFMGLVHTTIPIV